MNRKKRKLTLNRDTIRRLTSDELMVVKGGTPPGPTNSCNGCPTFYFSSYPDLPPCNSAKCPILTGIPCHG